MYQYFVKVVPTIYNKLAGEVCVRTVFGYSALIKCLFRLSRPTSFQ